MTALSRTKGHDFERRIASQLRAAFPRATIRRSSQAHAAYEPDVVIEGDAPPLVLRLWLELETGRAPQPEGKLRQAERDVARRADGYLPVVVWHLHASRSVHATMRLAVLCILVGGVGGEKAADVVVTVDWDHLLDLIAKETP